MDKKEKNARKAKLSEYINLANGRYKDYEIEKLEDIVNNRNNLDGMKKKYKSSYKTFDSEDTYRVNEEITYTFNSSDSGKISITRDCERRWDDGQHDVWHDKYDTARSILDIFREKFKK